MSEKALSIVVPIYGVEKYLRQCVDSILAQTFAYFEVLLIDDGSKDGCPGICDEYAVKDSRVRVIHKPNGGYGSAVNVGFDAADGEWIGIVEPDDWINANMYEVLMGRVDDEVDLVKANFAYCDGAGKIGGRGCICTGLPEGSFSPRDGHEIFNNHPSIWTCIYRASFLRRHSIRMKEVAGGGWVDNPFQVQTMWLARKMRYVDEVVYNYRVEDDSLELLRKKGGWRLPFDRSMDIHDWLEAQGVDNRAFIAALYLRELHYLGVMLRVYAADGEEAILESIRTLARRFSPEVVRRPWMNVWQRQIVWEYKVCPRIHLLRDCGVWMNRLVRVVELMLGIGWR